MHRTIIVTDLTRFKPGNPNVCIAGIDQSNCECIRPMPYLQSAFCKDNDILPGAVLSGQFTPSTERSGPHQEDFSLRDLKLQGPCSSEDFRNVLQTSSFKGVEVGFEIELPDGEKVLPIDHTVGRSIITIRCEPKDIEIIDDNYSPGKIKLNFRDQTGRSFRYIPITDLGFHDFAIGHQERSELRKLNDFVHSQEEVFLRIGLSRSFKAPNGREGFWIQANGIYTFPDYLEEIRSYSS
jgi:hypothetical protein